MMDCAGIVHADRMFVGVLLRLPVLELQQTFIENNQAKASNSRVEWRLKDSVDASPRHAVDTCQVFIMFGGISEKAAGQSHESSRRGTR
jgi:hypothetical protein